MSSIKKFYEAVIAEGGNPETEVLETEVPEKVEEIKAEPKEAKPSIAAEMAKKGVLKTDSLATKPIVNNEKKEETKKAEVVPPVETTTETPKAEAKPESQSPEKQEVKEQPQKVETPKAQTSWQEVLKSQQPNEVLKELGFDDKTVQLTQKLKGFEKIDFFYNLIHEWETKGDLTGYLKELTTDYAKMQPEEVMRHQLRLEYPKASEKQLDILFKNEVIKAYNLDSEDPDEVEEGKLLLEAKADKFRDTLIDGQKKKLFPDVPEAKAPEPDLTEQRRQEDYDKYKTAVLESDYTKDVFNNKRITVGKGKNAFNYPVEPEEVQNLLFDNEAWFDNIFDVERNTDGTIKSYKPKTEKQILISAFAKDPQKFLKEYAKHFESLGGEKAIESIDNAKPAKIPVPSNIEGAPKSVAEAMAKKGRLVTGGV